MAITITLADELVAELEHRAREQQVTVEQIAIGILTEALQEFEAVTPREVVARIQATAPDPRMIRPPTASLADLLQAGPGDAAFEREAWNRQWSAIWSTRRIQS